MDVGDMMLVVVRAFDAVFSVSGAPDLQARTQFLLHAKREPALDQLDCFFQRDVGRWREEEMEMVRQEDEFVR